MEWRSEAAGRYLEQMVQAEMLSLHQLLSLKQKRGASPLVEPGIGEALTRSLVYRTNVLIS